MILIFIYFWINAFLVGSIATTEVFNNGEKRTKAKMLFIAIFFGLPMFIFHIIKTKK